MPTIYVFCQRYEKCQNFLSENVHFLVVKFSIYLNRRGFVMEIDFFLNCNRYQNIRFEMINTISTIITPTINLLLFGSQTLSFFENIQVFKAVQTFISKSKRCTRECRIPQYYIPIYYL